MTNIARYFILEQKGVRMFVKFLSSKFYDDPAGNYGDCILVDNGSELVVYDCGSEEHAKRVISYLKDKQYAKIIVVISHNDADHVKGIKYLIDSGVVSCVYALSLYHYKQEIYDLIGNNHLRLNTIIDRIDSNFNNIVDLVGEIELKDIFKHKDVANGVNIIGPSISYTLNAIAKLLDGREGNTIDDETIINAVSTQLSVSFGANKLLLTGDSSFDPIKNSVKGHNAIQLPHHGKLLQAERIFDIKDNSTIYFVSDNTGDSNGGSYDLRQKHSRGYVIHNTYFGDVDCNLTSFSATAYKDCYSKISDYAVPIT